MKLRDFFHFYVLQVSHELPAEIFQLLSKASHPLFKNREDFHEISHTNNNFLSLYFKVNKPEFKFISEKF